jgi:cob(I)alamin adenosyltransferase
MRYETNLLTGEVTEHDDEVVNYVPSKEELNAPIFAKLAEIDTKSIRAIREYIASKPDAPKLAKDLEAEAATERGKLKK